MKLLFPTCPIANPLYTAPLSAVGFAELSTSSTGQVGSTVGFQPLMVPSSVEKIKNAGPDLPFLVTKKDLPSPLKTSPVGATDGGLGHAPPGTGIVTTSDRAVPSPRCIVETPAPLSAIQIGDVALKAMPHGFTRFGFVNFAIPEISETRFVWSYDPAIAGTHTQTRATHKSARLCRVFQRVTRLTAVIGDPPVVGLWGRLAAKRAGSAAQALR